MKHYLDDLYAVRDIINNKQVILSPTDTVWSLLCDALDPAAVNNLFLLKGFLIQEEMEIIVHSIAQFKDYISEIHPRIETLMYYHERPLSIYCNAGIKVPDQLYDKSQELAFRITSDPLLIDLIELLDRPLLSVPASLTANRYPTHYSDIDEELIINCSYTVQSRRHLRSQMKPAVLISFDEEGELIFHRE